MTTDVRSRLLRGLTLLLVLADVFLAATWPGFMRSGASIRAITMRHDNLFVPATWSSTVWVFVAAGMVAYGVWSLLRKQRENETADSLDGWLLVASLLAAPWIVAYGHDRIALSLVLMIGMLACSAAAFAHATLCVRHDDISPWVRAPFSLLFASLLAMMFVNSMVFFVSRGATIDPAFAVIAIALYAGTSIVVAGVAHDAITPAVAAFTCLAIWDVDRGVSAAVSTTAFVGAVLSMSIALIVLAWRIGSREDYFRRRQPLLFTSWRTPGVASETRLREQE